MLDFLLDSSRSGFPTLPKLTEDEVCSIWARVSEFIAHQMALQKGVQIPGLGTFTLSRHTLNVGNNKSIVLQRPVFLFSEKVAQLHGLSYNKIFTTGDIPVVPLNYMTLAFGSSFSRDIIEGCVRDTLSAFSRSIATKQNVEFDFKGIGALVIRDLKAKMKFYKDFINSMDGTGNLVKSLANRPGTCDSVMSERDSPVHRPRTFLFPRIEGKGEGNAATMEAIAEEKGEPECLGPSPKEPVDKEQEGEDDNTSRRDVSSPKRLDNRPCIVPAKVTGISLDMERMIKPKTAPERLGSSLSASFPKADYEGGNNQTNLLGIRVPTPGTPCQDHCRAGQELCYLCMQRAQKNIPVYFTEERRLKEQEDERILQEYQHMKDQEALVKSQLASLANRKQYEKDAAYNMGVGEAVRNEKNKRNMDFYKSYFFQKRPLTPPAYLKQDQCYQSLTKQIAEKKSKELTLKQDKDLLDRLEQMQLSEELTAQRAKFLKEKNEQVQCYKSALDTQITTQGKMKPAFLLSSEPDVTEPVFGRNDMTNEKLVEKRKRALEVSKQQLQASVERKRLAVLNELLQQRQEGDMLAKSKQQMVSDKADQYNKMYRIQKALQEEWAKCAELKQHKDNEEEKFIQAGSHLLLDQFDKYRRCFQCKRRPSNRGQSNIWSESRYIPGARLFI
ncbi:coiled-coil domain-containing protein 81 [Xenopus tropicalis]|uniref:Coiled-coil domain-containing protein 81 n=1 Tax=Xenopus tropicalis TaxID=8364 RepID=B1H2Q7_XENTR|nr:coiled-coil domain-containing protein 81 [Xenopus tropicalis]AAI61091.1 LOC100145462 protein [Xenopus tropicalis]|eukprot:NP_001120387.1 coiled-coil domain-containing protein 81 [Xenopus tropicalis]